MSGPSPAPLGLLLSDDLIFTSRITGTGRALGLEVRGVATVPELLRLARELAPSCVLVDLAHPGLAIGDLLPGLEEACRPRPRVVAYGPHVDAAALRAAREAGCDPVLPRSKFVEQLDEALPGWLAPP